MSKVIVSNSSASTIRIDIYTDSTCNKQYSHKVITAGIQNDQVGLPEQSGNYFKVEYSAATSDVTIYKSCSPPENTPVYTLADGDSLDVTDVLKGGVLKLRGKQIVPVPS